MSDKQLEKYIQNEMASIRRDLDILIKNNALKISQGYEKLIGEVKETLSDAAGIVKKEVGHGLSEYDARVQEYANKVHGDLGDIATNYPWVAITVGLGIGLILGGLLKPARKV